MLIESKIFRLKRKMLEITLCSAFLLLAKTLSLESWSLGSYACLDREVKVFSRLAVFMCNHSLVVRCGNRLCRLGLPVSQSPSLDGCWIALCRLCLCFTSSGSQFAVPVVPLFRPLWRSYLGALTSGWVAGNSGRCAAPLESVLLMPFCHPVSKAGLSLQAEKQWDLFWPEA